jgi:hypothetical protein
MDTFGHLPPGGHAMSLIYRGQVRDGVVVLPGDADLVEGTEVFIVPRVDRAREPSLEPAATIWETLSALGRATEAMPYELPDEADLAASPEFWEMIGQRRSEPSLLWKDAKAELECD